MENSNERGLSILGALLAFGLILAALIFGMQAKHIGSGKQTITVKGLAEQPIEATRAQWQIKVSAHGDTLTASLQALRKERASLNKYLDSYGFKQNLMSQTTESIEPNRVESTNEFGRTVYVQQGYNSSQTLTVKSEDLAKMQNALANIIEFKAQGHGVDSESMAYLVGNLDEIKLKLIGVATKNAKARALEFAKFGDVNVGVMRSASQGTFDILSDEGNEPDDSYGGSYDTGTIGKIARVVVTIEYEIEK